MNTESSPKVSTESPKINAESTAKMSTGPSTKFFAGLALGAVIGAAVALLYAPQSGQETRRMVKEKASAIKEGASKAISKAAVKEKALAIKEKVSKALSKIKESDDSLRKTQSKKAKPA